ncbi:hypothetical protein, partial [Salmonella enterica]|uniref:hypothetical protein n=1 Tax=Salmonella enterica TaxID=28901 RepID=UPI0019D5EF28
RNLFTCFYTRQGMEGDRAGLHRTRQHKYGIYLLVFMPVRAWKATAPDSTGHRPQIAGNCGTDRSNRPTPLPAKP